MIVLGALCQLKNNKYSLEDPTGLVDLDLTEAKFHRGLYTENCFVLVEGWYEDLVFHVVAMGHPPVEKSEVSLSIFSAFVNKAVINCLWSLSKHWFSKKIFLESPTLLGRVF